MVFRDRIHGGQVIAEKLSAYAGDSTIVVALPRGGLPVAYEVAKALDAPLDVLVARKLGAPRQPEFGFGAIAPGVEVIDEDTVRMLGLERDEIDSIIERERAEMERREELFRGSLPATSLADKIVLVIDDGLATGVTARAALESARAQGPRRLVFAAPVCAPDSAAALRSYADEVVCAAEPEAFRAVGFWYEDFRQTTDEEVRSILAEAHQAGGYRGFNPGRPVVSHAVTVKAEDVKLAGDLTIPPDPVGIVLFAHGSGSSRRSPRNRYVAEELNKAGLATLLFDLLTPSEESVDVYTAQYRFDVSRLARRLAFATAWVRDHHETRGLAVGYFGASTGGAAALIAAAQAPENVHAVVSRGGRPDMAEEALERVEAPTLLIVGGNDDVVIGLNRQAFSRLHCEKRLDIVSGAGHLFEEPGTLEQVAHLAAEWFGRHLGAAQFEYPRPTLEEERRAEP